jgi:hypothetical protein
MPRLHREPEKLARIVAVQVGASIPCQGDQTTLVTSLVLLPSPEWRPPGHPERPSDGLSIEPQKASGKLSFWRFLPVVP